MARIYHITHVDNLPGIVEAGGLFADADNRVNAHVHTKVGMKVIKQRRQMLPVTSQRGTVVGQYVPFYFCSRSVMLYLLHRGNHPDLEYRGGQAPIVHLVADLDRVVHWATQSHTRWAFSFSNAGARYARFSSSANDLQLLNWNTIASRDFREPEVKEAKQAEFLVHTFFPFSQVDEIGVLSSNVEAKVRTALRVGPHIPTVQIRRDWYY